MAGSTRSQDEDHDDEVRLWREGEQWVITDVETGVTTQSETKEHALEMLEDALYRGEAGREPTDEELREIGIDPEDNTTGNSEPPEFMQWMGRRTFSGTEIEKVPVNLGDFEWRRTNGDHAQLYYTHPTNEDGRRQVTVPRHDEVSIGTRRDIAESAGANDFDSFGAWIERNA
jgi:predicted RNase H-like HicB family nuclease